MAAILLIGGTMVAIGATLGGFMMGGGKPMQLIHPGEIIIIAGIATSIVLISSPFAVLTRLIKDLMTCKGRRHNQGAFHEYASITV